MKELYILVILVSLIIGVAISIVFVALSVDPGSDEMVTRVENEQQHLITLCYEKGGVPSIGYNTMGFPKTYLERCDLPLNHSK